MYTDTDTDTDTAIQSSRLGVNLDMQLEEGFARGSTADFVPEVRQINRRPFTNLSLLPLIILFTFRVLLSCV